VQESSLWHNGHSPVGSIPLGKIAIIQLAIDTFEEASTILRTRYQPLMESLAYTFCVGTPLLVGQYEASIEGIMMQVSEECELSTPKGDRASYNL